MKPRHRLPLILLFFMLVRSSFCQQLPILEKTQNKSIPDVEQPSLHVAPFIYYKPAIILLNLHDTVSGTVYWRKNFTDQFLETWADARMYPASRVFGFIQDSIYFRSTACDGYHIFAPRISQGAISLYYTRIIHNMGEIRMVSKDPLNKDYLNNMIVTGDVPSRYANEFTYFVTFPWDTLKMVTVTRQSLKGFSNTYLRAYPEAYKESKKFERSSTEKILSYTLIPVAAVGTAAFLLVESNPVYFIGIGVGALVAYISVKLVMKPRVLDPAGMIGIIERCR